MKKDFIQGIPCDNYGENNYSCGMEAIIFRPQNVSLDDVMNLDGVYLHPTCEPNSLEIFALKGSHDNFLKFYKRCIQSEMTKKAFNELGHPTTDEEWEILKNKINEFVSNFRAWYEPTEADCWDGDESDKCLQ